jgi:serine/threonine-protein kinase
MPPLVGFEKIRLLGLGDGEFHVNVFLARESASGRLVSVQHYLGPWVEIEEYLSRSLGEADGLEHPHILQVLRAAETEGGGYVIREHCEARTLAERAREAGRLEVLDALSAFAQAADAIGFAHANGMLHCDLNPHNISLTSDGQVKVSGFIGPRIAKVGFGGIAYAAPELVLGSELTVQTDVYLLGATFYEVLTGEAPFEDEDAMALMKKIVREAPRPASRINKEVPSGLDELLLRAMAKDPAGRFEDAGKLGEAVDSVRRQLSG